MFRQGEINCFRMCRLNAMLLIDIVAAGNSQFVTVWNIGFRKKFEFVWHKTPKAARV